VITENKALTVLDQINSCSKFTSFHRQLVRCTPFRTWKATSDSRPGI